jgi:hypothetical protein
VALSYDDGETWQKRQLPGLVTVGYTTATQTPNGLIHIVTSKNQPDLEIELNEAWVQKGGPEMPVFASKDVRTYRDGYAGGTPKATWSAGFGEDGRYRLEGPQIFYYQNGQKQWEATFQAGRKTGVETWWSEAGRKLWERSYGTGGEWTWRLFDAAGHLTSESRWKGKVLLDAKLGL